ncbi:hypothetical protein KQ940_07900 [Marinobacterium sp. D7]|uniref:hypothetical protein n=1 Tax=Marinobacterium ramblicola TaxID=2849041 RepID=UPI001C2DA2A4|nr:hypothetical protein [Marinobacterium ramblicola]MBV1787974.1 hypothetical protein [Marinobacterium ramblicola]
MIRLLFGLLVALGLPVQAQEAEQEMEVQQSDPAAVSVQQMQSGDGLPQMPPREAFDEIVQRPLFSVNRRPSEAVVGDSSESTLRETWKLTGVVLVDQQPQALFAERNGERKLRLNNGMPLDQSWLVESIEPQSVTLNNGEQSVRMEVFEPRELPPPQPEQPSTDEEVGEDQAPASIEERTQSAAQQVRERVEALKGGSQ